MKLAKCFPYENPNSRFLQYPPTFEVTDQSKVAEMMYKGSLITLIFSH